MANSFCLYILVPLLILGPLDPEQMILRLTYILEDNIFEHEGGESAAN